MRQPAAAEPTPSTEPSADLETRRRPTPEHRRHDRVLPAAGALPPSREAGDATLVTQQSLYEAATVGETDLASRPANHLASSYPGRPRQGQPTDAALEGDRPVTSRIGPRPRSMLLWTGSRGCCLSESGHIANREPKVRREYYLLR